MRPLFLYYYYYCYDLVPAHTSFPQAWYARMYCLFSFENWFCLSFCEPNQLTSFVVTLSACLFFFFFFFSSNVNSVCLYISSFCLRTRSLSFLFDSICFSFKSKTTKKKLESIILSLSLFHTHSFILALSYLYSTSFLSFKSRVLGKFQFHC